MFSIIIPLYNKAPYIAKTLHSVINQTYKKFELIIVDDGSKDNSLEIAKSALNQSNIDYQLIDQPNAGVSTARNNGVKAAKYDYISFLDADDWWEPTFLEEMKMLVKEFSDAGIYGSSYYKVKRGKYIPAQIGVEKGFLRGYFDYINAYSVSPWMPLWTGAVIIPKNIFNQMQGFKPQLKLGEDFDLWIRIALQYKTALLNKPFAYYNQDVDEQNRAVAKKAIFPPESYVTFNLTFLKEEEKKNKTLKKLLDQLRVISLYRYRVQGKYIEKVNEIVKTIDFSHLERQYYYFYKLPRPIILFREFLLQLMVKIKQYVYKNNYSKNTK
jgi:Glycosyltransferases, probably involved in cell wall biogenesis